jgi:membrane-associated phospholipid phosphatase
MNSFGTCRASVLRGLFLLIFFFFVFTRIVSAAEPSGPSTPMPAGRFGALHARELPIIRRFQESVRMPRLMRAITDLGVSKFNWVCIALLYFYGRPKLAVRLAVFYVLGLWMREVLAMAWQSPRPYWIDSRVLTFGAAPTRATFGFPSGHAMMGGAFWFFLAGEARRAWAWAAATVLAILICASRVYLGVHFVSDVAVGFCFSLLYTLIYRSREESFIQRFRALHGKERLRASAIIGGLIGIAMFLCTFVVRSAFSDPLPIQWADFARNARSLGPSAAYGGMIFGTGIALGLIRRWPDPNDMWRVKSLATFLAIVAVASARKPLLAWFHSATSESPAEWNSCVLEFLVCAGAAWFCWYALPWWFARRTKI